MTAPGPSELTRRQAAALRRVILAKLQEQAARATTRMLANEAREVLAPGTYRLPVRSMGLVTVELQRGKPVRVTWDIDVLFAGTDTDTEEEQ